ncbi:MAG: hypothetical protein JW864_09345 [Spirochaetes bacterium]|nr:hypothetical protein [Spirochaetota bacterium]
MSRNPNVHYFNMEHAILCFDPGSSTLLCRSGRAGKKKLWIKKLNGLMEIFAIIEDNKRFYIACDSGDINGQFIAMQKDTGITDWFIPGKSFLHLLYKDFLYLIFSDESGQYYLLKVNLKDGKSVWYHPVDRDLNEYVFVDNKVKLNYLSGKSEAISIRTGKPAR